jgi:hypothetical protein
MYMHEFHSQKSEASKTYLWLLPPGFDDFSNIAVENIRVVVTGDQNLGYIPSVWW